MQLTSVFFLLALVAPIAAVAGPPADRAPRALCAVEVTSPLFDPPEDVRVPSFSAMQVRDLLFRARLRPGSPAFSVRVYTPGGHLYQTLTPSLSGTEEGRGGLAATAWLPVTGTAITTNALYGRWKVEPWLAGGATACGPAREFVLTE
jgi:hypothetical protein